MAQYPGVIELSSVGTTTNGFKLTGEAAGDFAGYSVASAGDINGDGFEDILIGARHADPNSTTSAGAAYIVFGKAGGFDATISLATIAAGTGGFKLNGTATGDATGDYTGTSVASAGDINGDGFDDFIIGAEHAGPSGAAYGVSYVIYGKAGSSGAQVDLSSLDGTVGFKITGETAAGYAGYSVSSAGDINGDGFDDMIIGARGINSAYVVFGKSESFGANLNLSTLPSSNGFQITGDAGSFAGVSVSSAGDINNDGFDDMIIGASRAGGNYSPGAAYVVLGKATFSADVNLADLGTLSGVPGFKISGAENHDDTGYSVSSAGDINGDGFADLIISAHNSSIYSTTDLGNAYIVFGHASGFSDINLASLGTAGFKITGEAALDRTGLAVSAAGDVNGDGFDDVIIGATQADPNGTSSGAAYVLLGKASGFPDVTLSTPADGSEFFKINGEAADNEIGRAVAAGDINGDGLSDLIIGTGRTSSLTGTTYVIFGILPDAAVNRTGTIASQTLAGGDFGDTLSGLGGDDNLFGNGGGDTLNGGAGADILNGGTGGDILKGDAGADVMKGGAGDDTYLVENSGDQVIEANIAGLDLVKSSVTFNLVGQFVEKLTLLGSDDINGTGNILANTIAGNSGDNTLKGGGDDDRLTGGLRKDVLFGGADHDTFIFKFGDSGITGTRADRIADWSSAADSIDMPFAATATNYFEHSTNAASIGSAATAAEGLAPDGKFYAFLFNSGNDTGYLLGDLDKNGSFETGIVLTGAGVGADFGSSDII